MSDFELVPPTREDNLEVITAKVTKDMLLNRKKSGTGTMGEPTQKQVIIRATEKDHERWKKTAEIKGLSMAEMIRELCNKYASETLDCQHPLEFRKSYPWAIICKKCNTRMETKK